MVTMYCGKWKTGIISAQCGTLANEVRVHSGSPGSKGNFYFFIFTPESWDLSVCIGQKREVKDLVLSTYHSTWYGGGRLSVCNGWLNEELNIGRKREKRSKELGSSQIKYVFLSDWWEPLILFSWPVSDFQTSLCRWLIFSTYTHGIFLLPPVVAVGMHSLCFFWKCVK